MCGNIARKNNSYLVDITARIVAVSLLFLSSNVVFFITEMKN
jgi:hypothetical protein